MSNAVPVEGAPSEPEAQGALLAVLQSAATANGNGSPATTDGYDGSLLLLISNSTGTATVVVEGSMDNFATAQDVMVLGVTKLSDSGTGTNTSRTVASGSIAVAASTTYLFLINDRMPFIRARISGAATLAGLTVKLYALPL
jgi:hypothetical protein